MLDIAAFIAAWPTSPFATRATSPWRATDQATEIIADLIASLPSEYAIAEGVAVHRTATIESSAILKPPVVVGANAFVAANAYLRGGVYLAANCIVGPACELKAVLMFESSKVAHLSFVGDSVIGACANIEAGAIIANYRNERDDKRIRIAHAGQVIDTGIDKFGALLGDYVRVGANSVIAPGTIIAPRQCVPRLTLVDQSAPG